MTCGSTQAKNHTTIVVADNTGWISILENVTVAVSVLQSPEQPVIPSSHFILLFVVPQSWKTIFRSPFKESVISSKYSALLHTLHSKVLLPCTIPARATRHS